MHDALYSAALHYQLGLLKRQAKLLKRSSQLTYTQALDTLAISLSYRDWQHLVYETQQAWDDHLLNTPLDPELHQLDLPALCRERPALITTIIEELTLTLFQELFETLLTKKEYAARAVDGSDSGIIFDDKNFAGWRLCVDEPGGYVFFGQYPARGKLVAVIDGSVPDEVVMDHITGDDSHDEQWALARAEAREHYRQMGVAEVVFHDMRLTEPMSDPRQLMDACYEAIKDSVQAQCGMAMDDSTDDIADNTDPSSPSLKLLL